MTGSSSNNVHRKISLKGSGMTGSSSNNVHSKISFQGSGITGSSSNNVHSKTLQNAVGWYVHQLEKGITTER